MEITSISHKTDLLFSRFSGNVIDREDCILIQTPENPTFHWGNYILFKEAPQKGDFKKWTELFKSEFPYYDEIHHYVFAWLEKSKGEIQEFLDLGFDLEKMILLTAQKVVQPPKYNSQVKIREICSDSNWEDVIQNQISCADAKYAGPGYEVFKRKQFTQYRTMVDKGIGQWYGGFLEGKLIAELGLFYIDSIGRFQNVGTHPDYRRRGVCQTLVYEVARQALISKQASILAMDADEEYYAAKIYESIGFAPTEKHFCLTWWQGNESI